MEIIRKRLTLEYWEEQGWFEGRLKNIPELLSTGQTLEELQENVREDCAHLLRDAEYASSKGYSYLDALDVLNAELQLVKLDAYQKASAQLQALSPERAAKVYAYIEDLVDLEALEDRVDADEARRHQQTDPNPWDSDDESDDDED